MRSSVWLTPVLLLGACVSTNAAVLDASVKLSPICDKGVIVYTDAGEVGKDCEEIALLNSRQVLRAGGLLAVITHCRTMLYES